MNAKLVMRAACTLVVVGTAAALPHAQSAQKAADYPTKPIRLLVGFPVGGGADVAARVIGPRMSESLGQQIIVDNRPGAGSSIASEITAKAPPDGYTLVSIGSSHAVNAALYPKLPYAAAAGFSAIAIVATSPVVITANPAVPAKTLKELIALARSRPGQLNYGAAGVNGINHLAAELLKRTANFDITLVPYKGVAQALPAVLAGEVQLMFATLPGSIGQIKAGRIRAIAVTSAKRANAAPDIPTVAESGVPGYEASSWFATARAGRHAENDRDEAERGSAESVADARSAGVADPPGHGPDRQHAGRSGCLSQVRDREVDAGRS